MDRHTLYGIFLIIFVPAVIIPANIAWLKWKDFREFKQYYEQVTLAANEIQPIDMETINAAYSKNVENWAQQASKRMERLYNVHKNDGNVEVDKSIVITRNLFNNLFKLKTELAASMEPLFSEKMRDKTTVGDEAAYEWRKQTLTDIDQYLQKNHDPFSQVADAFRASIGKSSLPEKYREYVWNDWFQNNKTLLKDMTPDMSDFEHKVNVYTRFYNFMYTHKDGYYINTNGDIVITNQRYAADYQALSRAIGSG